MDIKQLRTFVTLATLQSFTLTAQALNYAQSTVTTQIQLLEKEFGIKLLERLGHRIALTPEGKRLLPFAEQIVKLANEAVSVMNYSDGPIGTLVIGAVESLCVLWLPRILKDYRSRYPNVEIIIRFGTSGEFIRSLRENALDIAFFLEKKLHVEDLSAEMEFPEPMVLLSAPEHPLAGKAAVYPGDLKEEAMILTENGCGYRAMFENILARYSVKPRSIIETGNVQAIKQLTISGMGITLLPQIAVEEELDRQLLVKLNWKGPEFDILAQVMVHKSKWISAPLKAFMELLQEEQHTKIIEPSASSAGLPQ